MLEPKVGGADRVLSFAGRWHIAPYKEELHTLYIEFCSQGKCFTQDKGPLLTVSAGLGKWRGIHKGVKL